MKKIIHVIIFALLLCLGLGVYYLFDSYRDSHEKEETKQMNHVYITGVSGSALNVYTEGEMKSLPMSGPQKDIPEGMANLSLNKGIVTKISLMPDMITGKVLSVSENEIEVEGYGVLKLSDDFKVFQLGEPIKSSTPERIIVGYSNVKFIVVDKKIHGALVENEWKASNIRVLLKTSDYSSYEHDTVKITATSDFSVTSGKETLPYKKGTEVVLNEKKRYYVKAPEGQITLLSLKRQGKTPNYRGTLEVIAKKNGYHIVNELPLEHYLYSVIPSEISVAYGAEAVKAQALCARSYGYGQILENKLRKYGAHVDDSVSFQVYNRIPENEEARKQVDATRGQVIMDGKKVASTYFFSTSCGLTSSAKDVWYTENEVPYLVSKLQTIPADNNVELEKQDFSDEKTFAKFLSDKRDSYDSDSIWYRWTVRLKAGNIRTSIEKNIQNRYQTNPSHIQVQTANGFKSQSISTIGDVEDIIVVKRGDGGVATAVEVRGSEATIRIFTEYNIRLLLFGVNTKISCHTGDKISSLTMLPSGFFIISKKKGEYILKGGGFGHGVGMSQNGAKKMAQSGIKYQEILAHFYPGTKLNFVY
ncbi:MAG: SpoIID/LytB domain-containing protein [Lachnoclostridium sp.]|jgi:stage II sporulation protein D|nr:SpoIID/LytB domain-containing protein [Lachnoclostridium sp.]